MKTISILGSGWLGLPLAKHFITLAYSVKASTTSENRTLELEAIGAEPFVIDIDSRTGNVKKFLQANILIINIPSKNIDNFHYLANNIEASNIEHVLFVSSTSVYQDVKQTISEYDTEYLLYGPLLEIENLLMRIGSVSSTTVRFGGLIGYNRHPGIFFKDGKVIHNPDSPVNLIHLDDCIGIIIQIVEQKLWGETLNCCADTHPTKKEFYSSAVTLLGRQLPKFGDSNPNAGKIINNQKVKKLLNYEFKYPDLMGIEFEQPQFASKD